MWQFISQNWWIFLFIAIMLFMHRPGGAGCCGGGKKHGNGHDSPEKDLQNKSSGDAGCCGGHKSK